MTSALSRSEKRYLLFIMTPALILLMSFTGPFYGWNAIVVPINELFGDADPETGWPGVISGGLILCSVFIGATLYNRVKRNSKHFLRLLIALHVSGYFLAAWSCSIRSYGLLVFSATYLGATQGTLYMHLFSGYLEWFRRWGKIGLGSGIIGCVIGLWPALHSLLAEDILAAIGLTRFLMGEALMVLGLAVAGSFFWRAASSLAGDSVKPVHIAWSSIVSERQFWLYEFFLLCFLLPGFGFKIVMQVVMFTTYGVTAATASFVAAAFLLSYALARLIFGYLSDRIPPRTVFLYLCAGQVACLLAAGLLIRMGGDTFLTFVILMCAVGALFAAGKCLWAVGVLWLWGPRHYVQLMGPSLFAFSAAGFIGPVSLNAALRGGDQADNLEHWLLFGAGLLLYCFFIMLRLKPHPSASH
ncbi:MAG: OFA family MFS transporter [Gammaproteobacteria bacterium]|nr:OFA family MFS transporter [Gammaproteobacteria bacterium]